MKYPKIYHLPFSKEIHRDDKEMSEKDVIKNFVNKEVIITEKLDGGNCCLSGGKVYARSHGGETKHSSFDKVKALYSKISLNNESLCYDFYGENMSAVHSITYDNLESPFYLFDIFWVDHNMWLSWDSISVISDLFKLKTVPVFYKGTFDSINKIKRWMDNTIDDYDFKRQIEGFVIRRIDSHSIDDFKNYRAKYVRKGHVQSDEHWSNNWKKQKIK